MALRLAASALLAIGYGQLELHVEFCWILGIRVIRLKMGGCSQKCLVGALTID